LGGAGLATATLASIGLAVDKERQAGPYVALYSTAALFSGLGFYILSTETPTERVLRRYREDPGVKLRAEVSALPGGGAAFGLSGTF